MQPGTQPGNTRSLEMFAAGLLLESRCAIWPITVLLLLFVGCSHRESFEVREKGLTSVMTPHPPIFFTGPSCVLLTNRGGYSARVTVQTEGISERERNFSGQLLGLGTKLLFAPDPSATSDKRGPNGGFSFIWDVSENRGFVLSEALQAYAPISSNIRITNLTVSAASSAPQKIAGHTCELAEATVKKEDGSSASFELLRATDLKGLPLKISSGSNSIQLTISLAKIRLESPGAEVFAPPDGFSKYTSTEAMADELAARQHNLRRKHTEEPLPFTGYPPSR